MKYTFLLLILSVTLNTHAQKKADSVSTKFIQRVTCGMIVGTAATITPTKNEPPFTLGYGLLANVTVVTPKTYHNLMYAFGDNSIRSLNGYFLPNMWDTYLVYSRGLSTGSNYLGLGIEKMAKVENLKFFIFTQIGTDFQGTNSLSTGVLVSVQHVLYKRR